MIHLQVPTWYAVYCKSHREEFANFHLQLRRIEAFLPLLSVPQPRRSQPRIVPLFPNYLFVKIRFYHEAQQIVWSPGVKRIIAFDGIPAPVDESVVQFLLARTNAEGVIVARSNLAIGQEVTIANGPFSGLVGIIQQPPDARGRIKVLMDLLNRRVPVEVSINCVDSGWAAY
jgi:transcriptional antiterminator RfaH